MFSILEVRLFVSVIWPVQVNASYEEMDWFVADETLLT